MPSKRRKTPYLLRKFRGVNTGLLAQNIGDDQFQELQNFYPYNGVLKRRGGLTKINATAYGSAITGIYAFKRGITNWDLIAGTATGLTKKDGSTLVAIPHDDGTTYTDSGTNLYIFKQYNNILYFTKPALASMQRCDGSTVGAAGLSPPSTAPTIAQGDPGALAAGNYYAVYTFYNSITRQESDYSPVSSVLNLAASKKINYSTLDVSTEAQADSRRLYRTWVGQEGQYFHVHTIGNNIDAAYAGENTIQDDMGAAASTKNGTPPVNPVTMEIFQERMWMSEGIDLFFSEIGLMESFGPFNYLYVKPDDGHRIVGLKAFSERLLIGKRNAVHYLTGTDQQSFEVRTLSDRHGVASHPSMVVTEGSCFWFGGDNFYATDGNSVASIGDVDIRAYVDGIDAANYAYVQGGINEKLGMAYWIIPYNSATPNLVLAYNYKSGDWTTFDYDSSIGYPQVFGDYYDANDAHIIYTTLSNVTGVVHEFVSSEADDDGTAIACIARGKSHGYESDDTLKYMHNVQVLLSTSQEAEDITMTLYRDDKAASLDTFSLNTYGGYLWKRASIANNGDLGTFLDLKLEYTGKSDIELSGLGFEIVDTGRRMVVP